MGCWVFCALRNSIVSARCTISRFRPSCAARASSAVTNPKSSKKETALRQERRAVIPTSAHVVQFHTLLDAGVTSGFLELKLRGLVAYSSGRALIFSGKWSLILLDLGCECSVN